MLQNHINKKLRSVFEINHIRLQKIMEMSQDTIVAFIVSLMAATFFNKYSFIWKEFATHPHMHLRGNCHPFKRRSPFILIPI